MPGPVLDSMNYKVTQELATSVVLQLVQEDQLHSHLLLLLLLPAPSNYSLRGHSMRLLQPSTRVNSYLNSFFPSSIKIWNNLPNDLITCSSLMEVNSLTVVSTKRITHASSQLRT